MSTEIISHYDNIRVKAGRNDNEYLSVSLSNVADSDLISFCRYCVPGRCDTYFFAWPNESQARRVEYFSDGWMPLAKAMELVAKDFDRPQVVKMMVEAFSAERIVCRYSRNFLQLVGILAPKSKVYRRVTALCKKTMLARVKRMAAKKEAVAAVSG